MRPKTMLVNYHLLVVISLSALFIVTGCETGGGGGPVQSEEGTYRTGYFVDSPVEGLGYRTLTFAGTTDENGGFMYVPGEPVTFFIGDIVLGSAAGKNIITPVDLGGRLADTSNTRVINIARLLMSLDKDRQPGNGIQLSKDIQDALSGIRIDLTRSDLDNDRGIQQLLDRLNGMGIYPEEAGEIGLIDASEARLHLENTITMIESEEAEAEEALKNLPLTCSIGTPYNYTRVIMLPGQSLNLACFAYGGKPPYTYSWTIDGTAVISTRANPGSYTFKTTGMHTITLTVTDSAKTIKKDIRHVMVVDPSTQSGVIVKDSIPTVQVIEPSFSSQTTFSKGETVLFKALITDGNLPLYLGWMVGDAQTNTLNPAGEVLESVAPRTYLLYQSITLGAPGTYTIGLAVQDTPVMGKGPDNHAHSVMIEVR